MRKAMSRRRGGVDCRVAVNKVGASGPATEVDLCGSFDQERTGGSGELCHQGKVYAGADSKATIKWGATMTEQL